MQFRRFLENDTSTVFDKRLKNIPIVANLKGVRKALNQFYLDNENVFDDLQSFCTNLEELGNERLTIVNKLKQCSQTFTKLVESFLAVASMMGESEENDDFLDIQYRPHKPHVSMTKPVPNFRLNEILRGLDLSKEMVEALDQAILTLRRLPDEGRILNDLFQNHQRFMSVYSQMTNDITVMVNHKKQ